MSDKKTLTADRVRKLLSYNQEDGFFTWVVNRNKLRAGTRAGSRRVDGYWSIGIDGRYYFAHRVAWLFMTGKWPSSDLDHIDGDKLNNAWRNLREVTEHENLQNQRRAHRSNKSGFLGVCTMRYGSNRFQARIRIDGRDTPLGRFSTPQEAHQAYINAKRKHHSGNTL